MKTYSCETHINHALDMLVAETKEFPIMEQLSEDEKLSTKCSYCEEQATYVVSSK
ncbi:CxxH/CxxC protein [Ureibacillus sp. 179-F W5.1 NHS]|uniref:CxxH/CxxC protein n=1 Tax=Lysinibacillus halotolerans TaxID=1368476 RepID=A0A3M8H919_9BACI|nr:CxxH/CxxC protein [Lysinibacillus halotolerans]RNC98892.1 CxxH/CxxC protein [Lysinibacillus halotolerans]